MTTRSGKADRSTVRLSVLSAISPPCSDLATMGLGQSDAGSARAHLQARSFSTAGHNPDHEHNLLIELNRRGVVKNLGRSRPDHPAGDGSRVIVKRKPHPDYDTANDSSIRAVYLPSTTCAIQLSCPSRKGSHALIYYTLPRHRSFSGPSTQRHEGGCRQERHAGHEAGQYHQREHPCHRTLVDHVDVVYRRFLLTRRREMDRAKKRQSRDGDEQMVTGHVASSGGQVDPGQDKNVDQQAERERRNLGLERPPRMVAPRNVVHVVQYAEDCSRRRKDEQPAPRTLPGRPQASRAIHAGAHGESSIRRPVFHSFPHSA